MKIEQRIAIEKRIVTKIVEDGLAAGYVLAVENGGDEHEYQGTDKARILEELFACDEEWIYFYTQDGHYKGQVYLVYGNDGYDVMADYSLSLEDVLKGANELADKIEADWNL